MGLSTHRMGTVGRFEDQVHVSYGPKSCPCFRWNRRPASGRPLPISVVGCLKPTLSGPSAGTDEGLQSDVELPFKTGLRQ